MKKIWLAAGVAVSLAITGCSSAVSPEKTNSGGAPQKDNTLTAQEKKDGWELLFDGKSLKGWHKYGGQPVGASWKIKDESIYLDAT